MLSCLQVTNTLTFPFSAIGELTGQLGTSNRCPSQHERPCDGFTPCLRSQSCLALPLLAKLVRSGSCKKICTSLHPALMGVYLLPVSSVWRQCHASRGLNYPGLINFPNMWSYLLPSNHALFACRGLECTGTLIGPKHVVTAAHCVFDINDSRQYVSSLNFSPGESSDSSLPFGTDQWSSVRVLSQFTSQASLLCQPCRAHMQVTSDLWSAAPSGALMAVWVVARSGSCAGCPDPIADGLANTQAKCVLG